MLLTWFLWEKTTLSQAVIAENLDMKNAANVSRIIRRIGLSRIEKEVPEMLKGFVSEKMKENEPERPVFKTGSMDFKKT
jgi:arginine repressor